MAIEQARPGGSFEVIKDIAEQAQRSGVTEADYAGTPAWNAKVRSEALGTLIRKIKGAGAYLSKIRFGKFNPNN